MRPSKILLVDAIINLILGALLATFPRSVVEFLGVPDTDATFYPSILGAVLIGMGVALVVECVKKPNGPFGLGLHGAIAINLCAAVFLTGWLLVGKLEIPLRGQVFLWGLAVVLITISLVELAFGRVAKHGVIEVGEDADGALGQWRPARGHRGPVLPGVQACAWQRRHRSLYQSHLSNVDAGYGIIQRQIDLSSDQEEFVHGILTEVVRPLPGRDLAAAL